ncbi:MAG: hypothetical protein Edafosvirus1_134 [Edafosvirus sp.]|uniref:RING-type domain-containing protein n=1 Tax=Edafosvirus sp. TaxID=2487765 RepID=A0A3G4ZW10_9VIRU|nr:MAG: hypothetical protein Edafosvirus1_134 [Edafosvirus sp.]
MQWDNCNCFSECKSECGPNDNYFFCNFPYNSRDRRFERCHIWLWIMLPAFIIGLPCLLVGQQQFMDNVNANIAMHTSIININNSIALENSIIANNNSLIALENDNITLENDYIETYNMQIQVDYPQVNFLYNLTNSTYFYNIVQTNCTFANDTLSIPMCSYIEANSSIINSCQSTGNCINQTCFPCDYVCKTKECTVYEEQKQCADSMIGCSVNYNFYTTYVCDHDPINNYQLCQSECVDFSCKEYNYNCHCICYNYNTKICPVVQQYMVKTLLYAYYKVNNTDYTIYNKTQICKIEDIACLNILVVPHSTNPNNIYYVRTDPSKLINDTTQFYKQYKLYKQYINYTPYAQDQEDQDQDQGTINLIIAGSVITGIALLFLLNEFRLMYPCCNCSFWKTVKLCFKRRPQQQPKKEEKQNVVNEIQLERKASELQCSICFEGLKSKVTKAIQCTHVFHVECIDPWLTQNPTCPLCRGSTNV